MGERAKTYPFKGKKKRVPLPPDEATTSLVHTSACTSSAWAQDFRKGERAATGGGANGPSCGRVCPRAPLLILTTYYCWLLHPGRSDAIKDGPPSANKHTSSPSQASSSSPLKKQATNDHLRSPSPSRRLDERVYACRPGVFCFNERRTGQQQQQQHQQTRK